MVAIAGLPEGRLNVAGLGFRSAIPQTLAVPVWLALMALLFSNAVFHAVGTYRTGRLSPGLRTAVLLYVPLMIFGFWHFLHDREVSPAAAVLAAPAGGSYHLWASLAHRRRARPA